MINGTVLKSLIQLCGKLRRQLIFHQKFHQAAHGRLLTELFADLLRLARCDA